MKWIYITDLGYWLYLYVSTTYNLAITRPILEIEKRILGQNGIEFQEKMIENIKLGKTLVLRTLHASYLSSTRNHKNFLFSLQIRQKVQCYNLLFTT